MSKWLFVFNSEILRVNQGHRSAGRSRQSFDHPPPPYWIPSVIACLVVKVGAEDIGEKSRCFRDRDAPQVLGDHAWRSQAVAIGPHTAMARVQVASTCGDFHLAGSHPHASGRVSLWLHPTVGTSMLAAAVNRPAHMNALKVERSAAVEIPWHSVRLRTLRDTRW